MDRSTEVQLLADLQQVPNGGLETGVTSCRSYLVVPVRVSASNLSSSWTRDQHNRSGPAAEPNATSSGGSQLRSKFVVWSNSSPKEESTAGSHAHCLSQAICRTLSCCYAMVPGARLDDIRGSSAVGSLNERNTAIVA